MSSISGHGRSSNIGLAVKQTTQSAQNNGVVDYLLSGKMCRAYFVCVGIEGPLEGMRLPEVTLFYFLGPSILLMVTMPILLVEPIKIEFC